MFQISRSSSWHARYTVLTYLQIMVFYNLFTFLSDAKAMSDVRALVLRLLEDEQLEVLSIHTHTVRYTPDMCTHASVFTYWNFFTIVLICAHNCTVRP